MAVDLAMKFAITAVVLDCATRKHLARAFHEANPGTSFDVDRSYKWLQGRAQPRDPKLYGEWLELLGLPHPVEWLQESTSEEFLEVVAGRFSASPERVSQQAAAFLGAANGQDRHSPLGLRGQLQGAYAAYSPAWSRYYLGKLIRGTLLIDQPRKLNRPQVTYSERLQGMQTRMQGSTYESGPLLFFNLLHEDGELPLFFSMFRPAPPVSMLLGHVAGASLIGPEPQPTVSRIVMIRVPAPGREVEDGNCYLGPDEPIVADLEALGLSVPQPDQVEQELQLFLRGGPQGAMDQVSAQDMSRVAGLFDPIWLQLDPVT